jgi:hypothetical protein
VSEKQEPPRVWDVVCGVDSDGVAGMQMTIAPLPKDEDVLRGLAICMRDAGKAYLVQRGYDVGEFVDTSPAGPSDRVQ